MHVAYSSTQHAIIFFISLTKSSPNPALQVYKCNALTQMQPLAMVICYTHYFPCLFPPALLDDQHPTADSSSLPCTIQGFPSPLSHLPPNTLPASSLTPQRSTRILACIPTPEPNLAHKICGPHLQLHKIHRPLLQNISHMNNVVTKCFFSALLQFKEH